MYEPPAVTTDSTWQQKLRQDLGVGVGGPDLCDHGLEGVQIKVGGGMDLSLDDAPPEKVKRIQIR